MDGNDFHWQWQNLVTPLLAKSAVDELEAERAELAGEDRSSVHSSIGLVAVPEGAVGDLSSNRLSAADSQYSSSNSSHLPPPPPPPIPTPSYSTPSNPSYSATSSTFEISTAASVESSLYSARALSTPPPSSSSTSNFTQGEFSAEALNRNRHQSEQGRASPSLLANYPPLNSSALNTPVSTPVATTPNELGSGSTGNGSTSKKWGSMFKKVSMKGMRAASSGIRPGGNGAMGRTFSEPGTPAEAVTAAGSGTGGGLTFRSRLLSRTSKYPLAGGGSNSLLTTTEDTKANRRTSYLKIGGLPALDLHLSPSDLGSAFATSEPPDQTAALRSVMAYLRDLDDLTAEISIANSAGGGGTPMGMGSTTFSPPLRQSPSLGALSSGRREERNVDSPPIQRAQSMRRIPRHAHSAGEAPALPLSQYIEDGERGVGGSERSIPSLDSSGAAPKLKVDPARRDLVIREIVETEKTYLKGLQELCEIYIGPAMVPVSSNSGKKDTVVPSAERRAVFGNVVSFLFRSCLSAEERNGR